MQSPRYHLVHTFTRVLPVLAFLVSLLGVPHLAAAPPRHDSVVRSGAPMQAARAISAVTPTSTPSPCGPTPCSPNTRTMYVVPDVIGPDRMPADAFVTVTAYGFPPETRLSFYLLRGFNQANAVGIFAKAFASHSKLLVPVGTEAMRITNGQGVYKGRVQIQSSARETVGPYTLYAYATYVTRSFGKDGMRRYAVAYHKLNVELHPK